MTSAGILVYRRGGGGIELLLVHPGGPVWAKKDLAAWSIPKGLVEDGEDNPSAARREFKEETGFDCPEGPSIDLGFVKMKSGKTVHAWAVEGDLDVTQIHSNLFEMEWPPRSGKKREFPEIDRGQYFSPTEALQKLHAYQQPFVERLLGSMNVAFPSSE
jgi:predicted NUDIX family NTP pyrophosphohydrolase